MKRMLIAQAVFAAVLVAAADDIKTFYGDWSGAAPVWTNSAGETVSWEDGSWAYLTKLLDGNRSLPSPGINCHGLILDSTRCNFYWNDGYAVSIGAGGLEFRRDGAFNAGSNGDSQGNARIRIMADQTWKAPSASNINYSDVNIGWVYAMLYWKMPLYADPSVHNLTLEGRLRLWMHSYANDLPNLDITVKHPARLIAVKAMNTSNEFNGKIRARKIKLSGDGYLTLPIGGTMPWHLNEYTITLHDTLDPDHFSETLELTDGADIQPLAAGTPISMSITNLLVNGTGESALSGAWTMTEPVTRVSFADGATLNLAGTFSEGVVPAAIEADGNGILKLNLAAFGLTGGISLGSQTVLSLVGNGTVPTLTGGREIRVDAGSGAFVYLGASALAGFTGNSIVVSSGTLVLDAPMAGVTVTTSGSGAVVYASQDPTIVTDAVRPESAYTLASGAMLKVFGDGMTAATALTLAGNNEIKFYGSATIAAPVTLSAGGAKSYVRLANSSVIGTIAGAVSVPDGGALVADGAGSVVFAGGGDFHESGHFEVLNGASATFTGGTYAFGGSAYVSMGTYSGGVYVNCGHYLGVCDGGVLSFGAIDMSLNASTAMDVQAPKNYTSGSDPTIFEIGEGGRVTLPGNRVIRIGSYGGTSRLKLSGGTLSMGEWSFLYIGFGGFSNGFFDFSAGVLEQRHSLRLNGNNNNSLINWTGGTWKVLPGTFTDNSLFDGGLSSGTRRVAVGVNGDCTLDLSGCGTPEFVNIAGTTNRGEWYGNGKLTVKGGRTFVMNSVPNGIDLALDGTGTTVRLSADARVFDYDACVANVVWRKPADFEYDSTSAQLADLSLRSLTVTNGAAALVNAKTGRTVTVGTATVESGGVWDNATTVDSALRSIGSLTFAENSIWRTTFVNGAAAALTLSGGSGVLSLPSAMGYSVVGNGTAPSRLIAAGSVTGSSVWSAVGASRGRDPVVFNDGLGLEMRGVTVILR